MHADCETMHHIIPTHNVFTAGIFTCLVFLLLLTLPTHAEVITLRSGQRVKGDIIVKNEEVVIVRTAGGTRYQYPMTEVASISQEDTTKNQDATPDVSTIPTTNKKVAMMVDVSGGAAYMPITGWGGHTGVDFLVGSHDILQRRIFLGGGLGYHAIFLGDNTYSFIPLQLTAHIPFLAARHTPVMGMSLGYGFALNSSTTGGLYANVDMGWKYNFNNKASMMLAANMQWQQLSTSVHETIDNNVYTNHIGANILMFGLKIGIQF